MSKAARLLNTPAFPFSFSFSFSTLAQSTSAGFMLAALRSRSLSLSSSPSSSPAIQQWILGFTGLNRTLCSSVVVENEISSNNINESLLNLEEVQSVLSDVKADDVRVIPIRKDCDWTDFMVVATGRSAWHVRNIAQALVYKVKQKQRGAKRMLLPSVEGEEGGKWVVIDSGTVVIHALDEKVRAYYNLEGLWTGVTSSKENAQDLDKALVKVRRKNNSKKPVQRST